MDSLHISYIRIIAVDLKSKSRYKYIKATFLNKLDQIKTDQLLECVRIKNNYIMHIWRKINIQ